MAAKNKMSDLRDHLFETLEALRDEENPMEIDRAKAICKVADTLIDSARVEVKFMEVCDASEVPEFFAQRPTQPALGHGFEDLRHKRAK
jgi:hypothetical protein